MNLAGKKEGRCSYCGGTFGKVAMTRHVTTCKSMLEEEKKRSDGIVRDFYLIVVQGHSSQYWLCLDVETTATLKDLDQFLRDTWLECCGHMSLFEIDGIQYASHPEKSLGDKSMNVKLEEVLNEVGAKFVHEYDFGSTTTLQLKVQSIRNGYKRHDSKGKIHLMARNNAPVFQCSYCDNTAEEICCECIYEDEGFLCESCAQTHECGEEMLLPVVNSPRMGACGYYG